MLVLSRRSGDSIVIEDNIEIIVLEIKGKTVKIGVTAPADVGVHRSEVFVDMQREKPQSDVSQ